MSNPTLNLNNRIAPQLALVSDQNAHTVALNGYTISEREIEGLMAMRCLEAEQMELAEKADLELIDPTALYADEDWCFLPEHIRLEIKSELAAARINDEDEGDVIHDQQVEDVTQMLGRWHADSDPSLFDYDS